MNKDINENIYVAINIGSSYISGLMASKHTSKLIAPIAMAREESRGSIVHGCIHNVIDVANIVSRILDKLTAKLRDGAVISSVYVGLDCRSMHSKAFKASLTLNDGGEIVSKEHIDQLREQAMQVELPGYEVLRIVDPRYYVDGRREGKAPQGVRCHKLEAVYQLIIVRSAIVENIREVFERKLGLRIMEILISPLAEAAVTLTSEEQGLGCAYVNIGGGTTSVSLYEGRHLSALYILPLGGQNVTRDLVDLKLLERDAEQIKIQQGSVDLSVPKDKVIEPLSGSKAYSLSLLEVNRYISARMMEIMRSVLHIIDKANASGDEPSSLVLSGGASRTLHFVEKLQHEGGGVRIGQVRPDLVSEDVDRKDLSEWQTELGLLYQATESCVEYTTRDLSSLMEEVKEEIQSTPVVTSEVVEIVPDAGDYTFSTDDEKEAESDNIAQQGGSPVDSQPSSGGTEKREGVLGGFIKSTKQWLQGVMASVNGEDESSSRD